MPDNGPGTWDAYQRLVLSTQREHGDALHEMQRELGAIRVEIATLKVKAGMWGATAGALPVLLLIGVQVLGGP